MPDYQYFLGVYLSKMIKQLPLTTLDLHGNVLRDVGAIALLQSLRQVNFVSISYEILCDELFAIA
jgi:hypothetical protein